MMQYVEPDQSYMTSVVYRAAVIQQAVSLNPQFFLTLSTNRNYPTSLISGQKMIDFLHAQLDRKLLGHNWHSQDHSGRTQSLSIPEGKPSYREGFLNQLHYHCFTAPARNSLRIVPRWEMEEMVSAMWAKACPGGNVDVQNIYDPWGAGEYSTKYLFGDHSIGMHGYCIN
jgi:hypothetical protein